VPSSGAPEKPDLHAHVILDARLPLAAFKAVVEHPAVTERLGARFAYSTEPLNGSAAYLTGGFLAYAVAQCDARVTRDPSFSERQARTVQWARWPSVISRLPKVLVAEVRELAREADRAQRAATWGGGERHLATAPGAIPAASTTRGGAAAASRPCMTRSKEKNKEETRKQEQHGGIA
jgi:hypothetical protein